MPGFEEDDDSDENYYDNEQSNSETTLPGLDDADEKENDDYGAYNNRSNVQHSKQERVSNKVNENAVERPKINYNDDNYNALLTSDKKVIAFVGTSKNGTSFIVNNVAKILSDSGINTAILDTTKNQNTYYVYTDNQDELRNIASESIPNLINGEDRGVKVSNNLSVYMETPNSEENNIEYVDPILETLVRNHSVILIDCDFSTPAEYFAKAQEIYVVQSMDILTIQPLTLFLRELEYQGVLDEQKLKIILNKVVRARGFSTKQIVEGMSVYKNADLSIWKQLFNSNNIKTILVPFSEEVYVRYLEQIAKCEIYTNKYPKDFQAILKDLSNVIYPLLPAKKDKSKPQKGYQYSTTGYSSNGFSSSVNDTLNNMKKRY